MKRVVSLLLIITLSLFIVTGCKKSGSKSIVGSWTHTGGYTYTFNKDKTGSYKVGDTEMKFTYEDDGKKVSILYKDNTAATDHEYKIEGKKLIIKDDFGNDVEYERD